MLLKSGEDYQPDPELILTLERAYPHIDVRGELDKMAAWCACNPSNRKTKRGIARFINSWLNRARPAPVARSTRSTSLHEDLTDTSWAL